MRILITGATGFVGSACIAAWQGKNHDIFGTARTLPPETTHYKALQCDLLDSIATADLLQTVRPDAVLHLAAQSSVGESWLKPHATISTNYNTTLNVLEAVAQTNAACRVVIAGSAEVYAPSDGALRECSQTYANNAYSFSKLQVEALAAFYKNIYAVDVVCTRSFNQIGPGQDERFVLPSFARQVRQQDAQGNDEIVLLVGNIEARRDFMHVGDMAAAYLLLLEAKHTNFDIYNIGSGHSTAISEMITLIGSHLGKPLHAKVDPARIRPNDVPLILADASRFMTEFGWSPRIPLAQAIAELYDSLQ
jgi:GDP-4-dehydro-6-deoxy-D-mannose reductase